MQVTVNKSFLKEISFVIIDVNDIDENYKKGVRNDILKCFFFKIVQTVGYKNTVCVSKTNL